MMLLCTFAARSAVGTESRVTHFFFLVMLEV